MLAALSLQRVRSYPCCDVVDCNPDALALWSYLGDMYDEGLGVPQNHAKAVEWFQKAADQGNDMGQVCLAGMYQQGLGVPQNHAKAAQWYQKAADQGNDGAKIALAWLRREPRWDILFDLCSSFCTTR